MSGLAIGCLPVVPLDEQGEPWVRRQQAMMRDRRQVGAPGEPRLGL